MDAEEEIAILSARVSVASIALRGAYACARACACTCTSAHMYELRV
jgi:hypothetical protein